MNESKKLLMSCLKEYGQTKWLRDLLKDGQVILDGIPVLREVCLIPFKAKAWLDLMKRKTNGEMVDSKNIKKHKNDIFRLGQLITAESR